jgi:hypothetical protein
MVCVIATKTATGKKLNKIRPIQIAQDCINLRGHAIKKVVMVYLLDISIVLL